MKVLRVIILLFLVIAFGAITLGNREGMTIFDVTNLIYGWAQTFDQIETGSTGVIFIDTLLKWKPIKWLTTTITFFAFAGSFATELFFFWWG